MDLRIAVLQVLVLGVLGVQGFAPGLLGVRGLAPGLLRVRGLALIGYYPSGLFGFAAFAGVVVFVG